MLTVEELSFGYPGKPILDQVSFCLRPGAITCLLGGNGAGKTTLFNVITGFLRPLSGSIRLGDLELSGKPAFRIGRAGIGRTFQDLRVIGNLSVRENILLALPGHPGERLVRALLPPTFQSNRNATDLDKAESLLAEFFLDRVADHLASEISYGQQKLLTLACCAALNAKHLLLDEPVAGINIEYRNLLSERIMGFKAAGKSILLIEHQRDFLERTGDTFLFLRNAQLQKFPSLDELRAAPITHDILV